jgi:hypothetical protein
MGILYPIGDGYGRNFVPEVGFDHGDGDGSMFMGTGLGSRSPTGNSPLTFLPPAKLTTSPDSSNYSPKGVPFYSHGYTIIPGDHSTNMSLRGGTQETTRVP